MLRKYLIVSLLIGQVVLIVVLVSVFLQQPSAASASNVSAPSSSPADAPLEQVAVNSYRWSFAAKFVCGYQPSTAAGPGEPVVKPGNYATEINIHNYNYKATPLHKKFIVLVNGQQIIREPEQIGPRAYMTMTLGPDYATMDDCNRLWQTAANTTTVPTPLPLFVGYLVILSPLDLDVDAVYTANAPGAPGTTPTSTSIDVERVTGKRVFIPAGALP